MKLVYKEVINMLAMILSCVRNKCKASSGQQTEKKRLNKGIGGLGEVKGLSALGILEVSWK